MSQPQIRSLNEILKLVNSAKHNLEHATDHRGRAALLRNNS